jgi:hypothetical protein
MRDAVLVVDLAKAFGANAGINTVTYENPYRRGGLTVTSISVEIRATDGKTQTFIVVLHSYFSHDVPSLNSTSLTSFFNAIPKKSSVFAQLRMSTS